MTKTANKKEAAKADFSDTTSSVSEKGQFIVFYRELTHEGTRTGSVASKEFSKRKEAEAFAEEVDGKVA